MRGKKPIKLHLFLSVIILLVNADKNHSTAIISNFGFCKMMLKGRRCVKKKKKKKNPNFALRDCCSYSVFWLYGVAFLSFYLDVYLRLYCYAMCHAIGPLTVIMLVISAVFETSLIKCSLSAFLLFSQPPSQMFYC